MRVRRLAAVVVTLVALLSWSVRGSATNPAHPAIVTSEFIYDVGPYPQVHASTLVETTSGQLLAAWFGGRQGAVQPTVTARLRG